MFMQTVRTIESIKKPRLLVERVEEYLHSKGLSAVILFEIDWFFVMPHECVAPRDNRSFTSFIAPGQKKINWLDKSQGRWTRYPL